MTNETKASVEKYLKAHEEISFKYDAAGRKMWYRSTFIKLSDGTSFWNESPDHKITKALAQCFLRNYNLTIDEFVAAENEYFKAKANETTETKAEVAEVETTETKVEVENNRITELKGDKLNLAKAINHALKGHFINHNGEFIAADDAGYTTVGADALHPAFKHLYRLENGEYVEVKENAINAFGHLEIELGCVIDAIHAEIARNAVKFVAGKWYTDSEGCKYLILKRTAKTVTVYNQDQDDWNALKSYDANDEIDGEFDCIFRKKIQFDERGEYVDWEDEEGELVQVFAKNETTPPTNDDDDDTQTETEQIKKRMSEIVAERDELYDVREEAEGNDEISQAWIDYLKSEIDTCNYEYNKLWARLEELKANQGNVA